MSLRIGDTAPDFQAETTEGRIRFHDWIGDSWGVLFSHPKDFTPVCTTELGYMAKLKPEFDKRNTKIIGLSVDPVDKPQAVVGRHQGDAGARAELSDDWRHRPDDLQGMGHAAGATEGSSEGRTAADNQTVRNVFVVGPDKKIKLIIVYPMTTGRNFDEVLRVIDSLQLTANHKVATPVNWKQGEDVIIAGSVSDEDAKKTVSGRLEGAAAVHPHRAAARCGENDVADHGPRLVRTANGETDEDTSGRSRRGVRRPRADDNSFGRVRRRHRHRARRQGRRVRLRLLETRRDVRTAAAGCRPSSVPRHRQARRPVRPDDRAVDRSGGPADRDRRRNIRRRRARRRARRRLRSRPPHPDWSRAATSSTRSPEPSRFATSSRTSSAGQRSSASAASRSSAHRRRARPPCCCTIT